MDRLATEIFTKALHPSPFLTLVPEYPKGRPLTDAQRLENQISELQQRAKDAIDVLEGRKIAVDPDEP